MNQTGWNNLFGTARVCVVAGHYGSGKSEIAVQIVRAWAGMGRKALLADMDIVNPFFRSLDAAALLETEGIRMVAPMYANTNVDVPALVPEIGAALRDPSCHVVLDVGGDDDGARVLGRYHRDIHQDELAMVFIFNARRPTTRNAETGAIQARAIEQASRKRFTHILNNTHLLDETTAADLADGEREALKLSKILDIPLAGSVVALTDSAIKIPLETPEINGSAIPLLRLERLLGCKFD